MPKIQKTESVILLEDLQRHYRVHFPSREPRKIASGWRVSPKTEWSLVSIRDTTWLVSTADEGNEWMNFYAQENGSYERFGYSLTEKRWSYDIEPSSAKTLLQLALAKCS